MNNKQVRAVLRNIQNNDAYLHLGENKYRNLRTSKEGVIEPEIASSLFNLNVPLTVMLGDNPNIEELISKLNLRIDYANN